MYQPQENDTFAGSLEHAEMEMLAFEREIAAFTDGEWEAEDEVATPITFYKKIPVERGNRCEGCAAEEDQNMCGVLPHCASGSTMAGTYQAYIFTANPK